MAKLLPIVSVEDKIIRQVAESVISIDSMEVQQLIDDLMLTCLSSNGVGISAPQVFKSQRLFIMSSRPNKRYPHAPVMEPIAVINPVLAWKSEVVESDWEGCLSVKGVRGLVPRHIKIQVTYIDRHGLRVETEFTGFLARLFQHELDHLNGLVFTDRVKSKKDLISEEEYLTLISLKGDS